MDPCTKAKDIEQISVRLDDIEEDIDGNGKPGIKGELIMIKDEQKHMNGLLKDMNTNLSAVVKFMIESQTITRMKLQTRDVVNMVITAVLSASAIATAFIIAKGGA